MTTPNTLLAAARLVEPNEYWSILNGLPAKLLNGEYIYFNPANSACAYALMLGLMKTGWTFEYTCHIRQSYLAANFDLEAQHEDINFPSLLLKCVETLETMK